jgi:transcriptional regulator with XRE-family HTH domain
MQPFEPTERSLLIGRRLQKLRKMHRMTQLEAVAASSLDMTDSTLSRLEKGQRLARDGELFALAKTYGVTLQHLTKQNSNLDREDFKIGDNWRGGGSYEEAETHADAVKQPPLPIPKPGPHLAPTMVKHIPPLQPVMTSIPAHLPPQPSASTLLTPAQYMERVYVPTLERKVAELTAQLEEANRLLRANGHREVVNA